MNTILGGAETTSMPSRLRLPWTTIIPWAVAGLLAFTALGGQVGILFDRDSQRDGGTTGRISLLEYSDKQHTEELRELRRAYQAVLEQLSEMKTQNQRMSEALGRIETRQKRNY